MLNLVSELLTQRRRYIKTYLKVIAQTDFQRLVCHLEIIRMQMYLSKYSKQHQQL